MIFSTLRSLPGILIRFFGGFIVRSIYRIQTVDAQNVPTEGGALLLPNHVSFADGFFITSACSRPVRFVMDEAFMASPAIRIFVSIFDTVTIRRDQPREAIRTTIEALKNGDLVCIFPEGQLTRTGTLSELRRGFELIAKKAGFPLIPMWCDGSWGSIFSFERGRFFSKLPRWSPVGMTLAFGPEIDPTNIDLLVVRQAMLTASATAQAKRFGNDEWSTRLPKENCEAVKQYSQHSLRRMWANGYQIGQVNALQRRQPFSILMESMNSLDLPGLILAFPELFESEVVTHDTLQPQPDTVWVGGDQLREQIVGASNLDKISFYDFGATALIPLDIAGVSHFPCLAVEGTVIAMSMPHPPRSLAESEYQPGHKPNSWGKLLPGWYFLTTESGGLRAHGPAAPEEGLPLPEGCWLDSDGFLRNNGLH